MFDRRSLLLASAGLLATAAGARAQTAPPAPAERLAVVSTFSILGDLVGNVGGDRIAQSVLVGPDGDAHVYSPRPGDARTLAAARIVFVNGLGFEGWINRLIRSSNARATVVEATAGIDRIRAVRGGHGHGHGHGHAHGTWDPHAWHSVTAVRRYVETIRDALGTADPAGAETYARNASAYLARLVELEAEVRALIGRIPEGDRKAVTTHDAFAYFERDFGFRFIGAQGISTDSEPTPAQIARLIRQLREQAVRVVFAENITNPRLVERIARETGARIGGRLHSDALSAADGPAATYIDLMRHNARTVAAAFATT